MNCRSRRPIPILLAVPVLLALASASPLQAQPPRWDRDSVFRDQAPLSDLDIPAAVELLGLLNSPAGRGPVREADLAEIAARHGLDSRRLRFAHLKIVAGVASMLAGDLSRSAAVELAGSPMAVPSPQELDVIRWHLPEIAAALQAGG
ncbi:MAG: hypothetical protein LBT40_08120 [Deltaproteobacteria bacterium]|jgi:hypothetical protein|nr:hypothetical protein [Deltaproteobacteria bacterium]